MALFKYGGARFGLFVVLTIVIQLFAVLIDAPVPLVMSALLALLVDALALGALGDGRLIGADGVLGVGAGGSAVGDDLHQDFSSCRSR